MTNMAAANTNDASTRTVTATRVIPARSVTTARVKPARPYLPDGLPEGTTVLTLDGAIPVEHLQDGDRIITRNSGPVELRAVRSRMLQSVRPVMIAPSALGQGNPEEEILMAPGQRVMVRGQAAIERFGREEASAHAIDLCDGETMMQATIPMRLRVYTLEFEAEQIVYAAGMEVACTPRTEGTRRPEAHVVPTAFRHVPLERTREEAEQPRPVAVRRIKPKARQVLVLTNNKSESDEVA